jgi:hypothetical protein
MTTEERMTIDERYKYLRKMKSRYVNGNRKGRGRLLDEMQAVTGLHRKSLTRLLRGTLERKPRCKQRGRTYDVEVLAAVELISASLEHPCAERLTPSLVWMAEHLAAHQELEVSAAVVKKLSRISISTVERHLRSMGQKRTRRPRKPPRAPNAALHGIPMGRIPWNTAEPGHLEADTVHHCGESASGEYIHTVQMVDVATGWAERRATLGRSYVVMEDAFRHILNQIPFSVRAVHPDNGGEFFNAHLRRFWEDEAPDVQLSRSRPYHKNDNPFVEQRNAHPVRTYLGYDRFDTVAQTQAINQLYDQMWLYHNFFQPVMRVVDKTVISQDGQRTRIRRHYDQARTPFDRLCATGVLSPDLQARLAALREQTNPRQLLAQIEAQLDYIFSLPCRSPDHTEVVFDTLSDIPDPRLQMALAR